MVSRIHWLLYALVFKGCGLISFVTYQLLHLTIKQNEVSSHVILLLLIIFHVLSVGMYVYC